MTNFGKLYNKIFDYSLKKTTHIKFNDMLKYTSTNIKHTIPITSKHIYNEIPIRLANRVTDLNNLPFGLSKNHSINKIREWYLTSFEELTSINEPNNKDDIDKFKNVIQNIYNRHSTTLTLITKGLIELHLENKIDDTEEPRIQLLLDRFHKNRTEIRILLQHYLSLFENKNEKYYGIINLETDIQSIILNAVDNIQYICDSNLINLELNEIIKLEISEKIYIPTIEHYFYYIIFELIKNSVEAVKNIYNPKIIITLKSIDEEWFLIKIEDNGNGISNENMDKIWYYSYSSNPINSKDIIEQIDFSNKSPLSGFGYGLPISNIYVNFLNSLNNNIYLTSNNSGTKTYIYFRKYLLKN